MPRLQMILAFALVLAASIGCGGRAATPVASSPTATVALTNTPSAPKSQARSVEDEVEAAYLAYWEVYAEAVLNRDDSRLGEVMTGPILERTRAEVADLRQRERAAQIDVEHHLAVLEVNDQAGTATVVDDYTNRSYVIDPVTRQPVGAIPTGSRISDTYFLVRTGQQWKVRDAIRAAIN